MCVHVCACMRACTQRWLPVCVGLSSIPLIVHPIDDFVDSMMTRTFRKWTDFEPLHRHKYTGDDEPLDSN
jgi:hypothetical protein